MSEQKTGYLLLSATAGSCLDWFKQARRPAVGSNLGKTSLLLANESSALVGSEGLEGLERFQIRGGPSGIRTQDRRIKSQWVSDATIRFETAVNLR